MTAILQTKLLGLEDGGEGSIMIFIHGYAFPWPGQSLLIQLKFQKTLDGYEITPQDNNHLQVLQTFFNKEFLYQAACVCLPGNKFMIIPDEYRAMTSTDWERKRISSYVFDLASKQTVQAPHSKAPKMAPFACLVGDKVYVLSSRESTPVVLYEPSFEAFDTLKNSWEILEMPLFNDEHDDYFKELMAIGCAVFENFILVCFCNRSNCIDVPIYSFDTVSKKWKRVSVPQYDDKPPVCPDSDLSPDAMEDYEMKLTSFEFKVDAECRIWYGEAAVIGQVLYTYHPHYQDLVSYSLTKAQSIEEDYDLSISKPTIMEGWKPVRWPLVGNYHDRCKVGAIGKIDDNSLYVIYTSEEGIMSGGDLQPIHFSIVSIDENDPERCTTIGSFNLDFPKGDDLFYQRIRSFSD